MAKIDLGRITPTYRGDYDSTVSYNELDIVYDDTIGKSFIAKQASKGKDLPVDKENEYWGIIAKQGPKGTAGEIGPKGEPGKDGIVPDFGNTSDLLPNNSDTVVGKLNGEFTDRGLNVKWFGAVGDGSTDDSTAIQTAIDIAYANFTNLASNTRITGSFEVDVPSGVYKINTTIVLPPMVKLKIIGFVQFKYNGQAGTPCIWVKQKDDVSKYSNGVIKKQAYTKGNIIDGSSGGLMITREGNRDCIGLAVGNTTNLGHNFPVSRYSMQGVMITGFDEAMHWYSINHYIGNYYNFHLENNNINLMIGDDDIPWKNSNENFSFYSSVIAAASTAAVYSKIGWDINFFGCSFDFNNVCFKNSDSTNWGRMNLVGCHLEGNNKILQKGPWGFEYSLTLKQCRIFLTSKTLGNKLFEGQANVTVRDCNYICSTFQTIDSLADDTIYLEESNNPCQNNEVILRLAETQSKDGNMISSDVSAFGLSNQTNANPLSKTIYNGKPALLVSSSGATFSAKVNLGILENVQPFKHNMHAAIKYACNHSSDDYSLTFAIVGTNKYKGTSRTKTVFSTTPVAAKDAETLASGKTDGDVSVFDTQGIRPYIIISTKEGVDASDFKFYVENVHVKID